MRFPLFYYLKSQPIMIEHQIEAWVLEKIAEPDFADCFVLQISIGEGKQVEIILDADKGVTFEKCQKISRFVEKHLDETQVLGEDFGIEVSSPGATRPLMIARQYPQHIGRNLKVNYTTPDNDTEQEDTGKLTAVNPETIVIEYEKVTKEGKKKIKEQVTTEIPFQNIKKAIIQLAF